MPWDGCHPSWGGGTPYDAGHPSGILRFAHLRREEQRPAQRFAMRHVYAVLRRTWDQGRSERQIAHRLGMSRPAVADSVRRAQAAGLAWPWPATSEEGTLERGLVPAVAPRAPAPHLVPDGATGQHARTRTGVTVCLLWQA